MPSYRVSVRAHADLDEILEFTIERWGIEQAGEYLDGLKELFYLVSSRPMMGRSAAQVMKNLRRVRYESHIVFYTPMPLGIQVERILHTSRALKRKDFRSE